MSSEDLVQSDTELAGSSEKVTVRANWLPIETAPMRGQFLVATSSPYEEERIFLNDADEDHKLRIHIDGQIIRDATHWMPLPQPPTNGDRDIEPANTAVSVNQTTSLQSE